MFLPLAANLGNMESPAVRVRWIESIAHPPRVDRAESGLSSPLGGA